jgi:hypothetical protein
MGLIYDKSFVFVVLCIYLSGEWGKCFFFFFVLFDVVKCYSVNYRKWNHRGLKGKFIDLFILQWSHVSQMSKT